MLFLFVFVLSFLSSRTVVRRTIIFNLFCAHYLLLLQTAHVKNKYGRSWRNHWLASTTIRNLAYHAAAGINLQLVPGVEAASCQELAIESHFSRIKASYRGMPTIKDMIYGTFLNHFQQKKALQQASFQKLTADREFAVPEEELSNLSKKALAATCELHSMLVVDRTAEQSYSLLRNWYRSEGATFFHAPNHDDEEEDEEDSFQLDMVEIEELDAIVKEDAVNVQEVAEGEEASEAS